MWLDSKFTKTLMKKLFLFINIFFTFFKINAYSIPLDLQKENVSPKGSLYIDQTTQITIQDILSKKYLFQEITQSVPNFGYSKYAYWYKLELTQTHSLEKEYVLLLRNHSVENLNFYIVNPQGEILKEIYTGSIFPFPTREIKHREFAFHVKLKQNEIQTIFVRVQSQRTINLPFNLYEHNYFYESTKREEYLHGIYYGIMLSMILYNFFIFTATLDISYFFYVLYITSVLLIQATGSGHAYEYLWPIFPKWNSVPLSFFLGLTICFSSWFSKNFLRTKLYSPIFNVLLILMSLLGILICIFSFFLPFILINYFTSLVGLVGLFIIFSTAVHVFRKNYFPSRFFLLGWSIFIFFSVIVLLRTLGVFPHNFFTQYGIQLGSIAETILLSFALADRLNQVKRERQELTLIKLQLEQETKRKLEIEVQNRTEELNKYINVIGKDLLMAKSIQNKFLPSKLWNLQSFKIITKYLPQEKVGGDYFDIFLLNETKLRVFLADATGHGIQAALITMTLKSEYDSLKDIFLDPAELTETLHQRFLNVYNNMNLYFTSIILDIDLSKSEITYCSSAHPTQFILRNTNLIYLPKTSSMMGLNKVPLSSKTISFYKTDKLFLFTDGLYEEFNSKHEQYGEERLMNILQKSYNQPIEQIVENVLSDLFLYMENTSTQDDLTIIGIEIK